MSSFAPNFSLAGQIALITGSSQGLGFAIAQAYAASGATVFINGRSADAVATAVQSIRQAGHAAYPFVQDINDLDSYTHNHNILCKVYGVPSIHVNCVGQRLRKSFAECTPTEITQHIQTNLTTTVQLSRLAAMAMRQSQQSGRIISLSSIAGRIARPGDSIYPIAKQGIEGMVRALAVEFGSDGITSNGIAPGTFATETNQALAADPIKGPQVLGRNPIQRWAQPHEIAGAAVFLASPSASYVNGHVMVIDGGFSITF
ncbi:MAG TPA: SDR family oxidoreductase [Paenalcaligenes hominis]|uniref:Gluconate 5-dehydrogenase n=1 Tax=Paenalcaligenes hominis TaxID=643674 RepID=A0A9D3AAE5_9BURK|nr:SDR family oxidoreductase [Paenalcaligenes hominis]NJB64502.1 gluconate 5-dehydrogenase [Paenalcaligenes hominis]GGE67143.1 gluconate 5-dehydrogenase [Paenalcaligenes hominis]HJH24078.1 SDR family oxidoreductase [Paenalcaligenes hominis]